MANESHWWYRGMAAITRSLIDAYYPRGINSRILDTGCGTGAAMAMLSSYGTVTGMDISPHAIDLCKRRGSLQVTRASVMSLPFADDTFDLVTSLDVLYFVDVDDEIALKEFARVLMPGGRFIVRVPAFDWLRGIHDVKVSTGHRYTLRELSEKMERNGIPPDFMSYANTILFPVIVLKRFSEKWTPPQRHSDIAVNMGFLERLFEYCLILESHLITKLPFPFGLSIFGFGQKPSKLREA